MVFDSRYKWLVLTNTTIATLITSLDINIVIVALPTIGKNLHGASLLDLLWMLVGYQAVMASLLVNFGRLADMFGRVRLYTLGFAIFAISSALCSLSQNGTELVVFRMVQGIGGAFLISNSTAIIVDAFPQNERGKALGINRASLVAGAAGGLVLGGFLTIVGGWQAIFWVNVPIGAFGALWSHYTIKEIGTLDKNTRIDLPGNLTFASGLGSLLVSVSLYALGYLALVYLILLLVLSATLFLSFVIIERRVENPMLRLSLFKIRPFAGGSLATLLNALARGCVLLVLTFYLQGPTMALDPLVAGLFLLPNAISISVFGPISGWLSDRGSARVYTTLGLLLTFTGFIALAQIGEKVSFFSLAAALTLVGAGQGIFSAPNRASVMNSVPAVRRGVSSAVTSTMQMVGNSFSRAFSFLVIGFVVPGAVLDSLLTGSGGLASDPTYIVEFVNSLHVLFYVCAGIMILSIFPSIMRGPNVTYEDTVEVTGD